MQKYLIKVMSGLGDAIYHRPFIKELSEQGNVTISTQYPALFNDLPVLFGDAAPDAIRPKYNTKTLRLHSIPNVIGKCLGVDHPVVPDLPQYPVPIDDVGAYAVVRAPSLRRGFYAPARNPDIRYLNQAVSMMRSAGLHVVAVGNFQCGEEWADGDLYADAYLTKGELGIDQLIGLIHGAEVMVGGPGWQVPASLASGTPMVVVYGGCGGPNQLDILCGDWEHEHIQAIYPDNFCWRCENIEHDCDKWISDFEKQFQQALLEVTQCTIQ